MTHKFNIQKPRQQYYSSSYDSLMRFASYYYQADLVKKLKPEKVLEIGIGNKTVTNYLKNFKIDIETCDFDKELEPDYASDIRDLPFKDNSYDLVMAYEILEHLPWQDVDKALSELQRVSSKYVLASIPCSCLLFEFIARFPLSRTLIKKPYLHFLFRIPRFFKKVKGEHYWEIGSKGYPLKKVRKALRKYFVIEKEIKPIFCSYHQFFILRKKNI